jgi:hypothetical protein
MKIDLRSSNATMAILIGGDLLFFVAAIGSYFFPQLADLRKELWGVFIGYNTGLMVALKVSGDDPKPLPYATFPEPMRLSAQPEIEPITVDLRTKK